MSDPFSTEGIGELGCWVDIDVPAVEPDKPLCTATDLIVSCVEEMCGLPLGHQGMHRPWLS